MNYLKHFTQSVGLGVSAFVIGAMFTKPPFQLWWQNGLVMGLSVTVALGLLFLPALRRGKRQ